MAAVIMRVGTEVGAAREVLIAPPGLESISGEGFNVGVEVAAGMAVFVGAFDLLGCEYAVPLYLEEAPQGTDFPYITFSLVDNVPEWGWPDETWETARIQFSIFAKGLEGLVSGAEQIGVIGAALKQCFDNQEIEVTGYSNAVLIREIETQFRVERVWQKNIDYLVRSDKN